MARAAFILTAAIALSGSAAACASPPRGKAGESCTKRADCEEGLFCVEQTCTSETADPTVGKDPGDELVAVSESTTAAAPRPKDATAGAPPDALDGASAIAGQYSDLASFCKDPKVHERNDIYDYKASDDDDLSSCDWSGTSMKSPHGEVQAILAGEDAVGTGIVHIGIKRETGLWVITDVGRVDGGSEAAGSSELSRVKVFGDGTIGVAVAHDEFERIDTNNGPGVAQGARTANSKSQWRCGVAKTEEYVCKKEF